MGNGMTFTASDITNVAITVSSTFYLDFTLLDIDFADGMLSADGLHAEFLNFSSGDPLTGLFGCYASRTLSCHHALVHLNNEHQSGTGETARVFSYSSDAAASASFSATAQVGAVPLPAGGLLLLSGLAGVAGLKRRKKRAA